MKRSSKVFWVLYIIWSLLNTGLLIMALNETFGEFDKSAEKFWPFSIDGLKSYDFLEMAVYLLLPLIIFFNYRLAHYYHEHKEKNAIHMIRRREVDEEIPAQ